MQFTQSATTVITKTKNNATYCCLGKIDIYLPCNGNIETYWHKKMFESNVLYMKLLTYITIIIFKYIYYYTKYTMCIKLYNGCFVDAST